MERFSTAIRAYSLLTKPGIIMGNAITTAAGFALASKGNLDFGVFFATLLGISSVIGSACVFNNSIDRNADRQMARTQNRALARGDISIVRAMGFAIVLGGLGIGILACFTHLLALWIALFGFVVYVGLYSFSKYRTVHGTLIGSIAGAVPPVIGYTAVSHRLDAGAVILFAMMTLWQMPHFFAIALYRMDEYAAASIPVLPLKRGVQATKQQMLVYILAFLAVSLLLGVYGYVGSGYLGVTALLGLCWAWLCLRGFGCANDRQWARSMFLFSLVVIMGICAVIPFSVRGSD